MAMGPIHLNLVFQPRMPEQDTERANVFSDEDYDRNYTEPFDDVARELTDLTVTLIRNLSDPSLSPDERLERLARVVPSSQMVTANMRTARSKLGQLRRRLDELVPDGSLTYQEKLEWLLKRLDELVPGDVRTIEKLERLGDYRSTDVGVSPRKWQ